MTENQIRFDDGAAYERMMGTWSRLAGNIFLEWLAPLPGLRWIDVGCGNGAFTAMLTERCAPAEVKGSIRPGRNSPLHALGLMCGLHSSSRATPRLFPSQNPGSMPLLWHW